MDVRLNKFLVATKIDSDWRSYFARSVFSTSVITVLSVSWSKKLKKLKFFLYSASRTCRFWTMSRIINSKLSAICNSRWIVENLSWIWIWIKVRTDDFNWKSVFSQYSMRDPCLLSFWVHSNQTYIKFYSCSRLKMRLGRDSLPLNQGSKGRNTRCTLLIFNNFINFVIIEFVQGNGFFHHVIN